MATFEELMEQFRNPGETGLPENFADDVSKAYMDSLSIRDAAVKDRDQKLLDAQKAIDEREQEMTRLKARNYDLLVGAPKAGEPDKEIDDTEPKPGSGIDSLFE